MIMQKEKEQEDLDQPTNDPFGDGVKKGHVTPGGTG